MKRDRSASSVVERDVKPANLDPRPYGRLSVADKQALHRERMRESAQVCPFCGTHTVVGQLERHVRTTCTRERAPHPLSKWLTWSEVLALGIPKGTLLYWIQRGIVQTKGTPGHRLYLYRDVELAHVRTLRMGSKIRS